MIVECGVFLHYRISKIVFEKKWIVGAILIYPLRKCQYYGQMLYTFSFFRENLLWINKRKFMERQDLSELNSLVAGVLLLFNLLV